MHDNAKADQFPSQQQHELQDLGPLFIPLTCSHLMGVVNILFIQHCTQSHKFERYITEQSKLITGQKRIEVVPRSHCSRLPPTLQP